MKKLKRDKARAIFTVPVLDKVLIYAPLNGCCALLNKSGVDLVKKALTQDSKALPLEFQNLIRKLAGSHRNPAKKGPLEPAFLGIIPSRRCNMACAYCNFGVHQNADQVLDADMMIAAIDWFAAHAEKTGRRSLPLQFFGGEPFVEKDLIDIAVHHTRYLGSRIGLYPHFEALSNGYYGEQTRRFIADYFDRIIISLDGFQPFHDVTRMGMNGASTFAPIVETINELSRTAIELAIRCCITSTSVHEMEAISEWFCEQFHPARVNFETLTENSFSQAAGLTPPDPYTFADHYMKSRRILRKYEVEPAYAPIALDAPQTTSCPVGRDVLIIHPDGMIACCYLQEHEWREKGLDLAVGQIKAGRVELDEQRLRGLRNLLKDKPRCSDCFCRYSCAGGCHVNNTFPDSPAHYTDYCVHTRIMTACCLLQEMAREEMVDELLQDKEAMRALAFFHSDKLAEFDESKR